MSTLKVGTAAVVAVSLALLLGVEALLGVMMPAAAHSWYPEKCCAGHDCSKVDSIEKLEDGDLLFRVGAISVVVPAEFQRLPSPDSDTHVCVYKVRGDLYRPRCVFVPGLM
jgi:hypothetical protein